jgi:LemA protein
MSYNNLREVFPNNLIAQRFGFTAARLLEIEEPRKREAIAVSFERP